MSIVLSIFLYTCTCVNFVPASFRDSNARTTDKKLYSFNEKKGGRERGGLAENRLGEGGERGGAVLLVT